MTFTTQWFEITAKKNFETFLLPRFANIANINFLEIGCWEGMATAWMCKNVLNGMDSYIDTIDTFQGSYDHQHGEVQLAGLKDRYNENVSAWANKVITHMGYSQDILKDHYKGWKEHFDFIYVDGSHRSPDAIQDLVLAFPMLKPGGIMAMDDYSSGKFRDVDNGCLAMEAFLACYEGQYKLLLKDYQIWIQKI